MSENFLILKYSISLVQQKDVEKGILKSVGITKKGPGLTV